MLTDDQRKRYSRQIALAEIGQQGQSALMEASVLVIGAGGIGAPLLQILAGAGIGHILIMDHDRIDLSNLHRQFLYRESDVGRMKADVTAQYLRALNSSVKIDAYSEKLTSENVKHYISNVDIVVDGCDNFATRFIVNEACVALQKPLFSGAVIEWQGQVAAFAGHEKDQPCYQCFCPSIPPETARVDCSMAGVTGAMTSIVASHLAMMLMKHITASGNQVFGKLHRFLPLADRNLISSIKKDPHCPVCG